MERKDSYSSPKRAELEWAWRSRGSHGGSTQSLWSKGGIRVICSEFDAAQSGLLSAREIRLMRIYPIFRSGPSGVCWCKDSTNSCRVLSGGKSHGMLSTR